MEQLYILCEKLLESPSPARVRYEIGCELQRMTTDTVQEYDFVNIFRLLNFYLSQTKYGFNLQIVLNFTEVVHPDTIILFQAVNKPFFHIVVAHNLVQHLDKYLERWQPDPSLVDQYNRTALHVATWNVSINCEAQLLNIRTLLKYGFDPKLKWHRSTIVYKLEFYLQNLINRKCEQEQKNIELRKEQRERTPFEHPYLEITPSVHTSSIHNTVNIDTPITDDESSNISEVFDNNDITNDNDQYVEISRSTSSSTTPLHSGQHDEIYHHVRLTSTKILEEKIIILNDTIEYAKLVIKTQEAIKRGIRERIKHRTLHQDTAVIIYEFLGWRFASTSNKHRTRKYCIKKNRFSRIKSCAF